jgi:hypothetical protein
LKAVIFYFIFEHFKKRSFVQFVFQHLKAVGHAAGWIIPLAWLITNERIRDYGCNAERAAAEYFSKACAPGALSAHFQTRDQVSDLSLQHP